MKSWTPYIYANLEQNFGPAYTGIPSEPPDVWRGQTTCFAGMDFV